MKYSVYQLLRIALKRVIFKDGAEPTKNAFPNPVSLKSWIEMDFKS